VIGTDYKKAVDVVLTCAVTNIGMWGFSGSALPLYTAMWVSGLVRLHLSQHTVCTFAQTAFFER
jgi:hypothetical protein